MGLPMACGWGKVIHQEDTAGKASVEEWWCGRMCCSPKTLLFLGLMVVVGADLGVPRLL